MTALDFHTFVSDVASAIAQHIQPEERAVEKGAGATTSLSQLPVETYCLDHEKIVWHFPDVASRLLDEVS